MARLASEGRVVTLEGDVDGAVSCLIGRLLGAPYAYVSDWLDHDDAGLTLWHPGHAPLEICAAGSARLGRHFNNGLPLVVNATLASASPITIFRLWRCDDCYSITAANARTELPRRELLGAHGRALLDDRNVHEWFESLCHEGMPHHVVALPGHRADELQRFARQMQIRWVP
jgi:L-fucose isomerase-like protein